MKLPWERNGRKEYGYLPGLAGVGRGVLVGRVEPAGADGRRFTAFVWNALGEAVPVPAGSREAARAIVEAAAERLAEADSAAVAGPPVDGGEAADRLIDDVVAGRDRLLPTSRVARMFRVHPSTVSRWADEERIAYVRTDGGQRRFSESEVLALLTEQGGESGGA